MVCITIAIPSVFADESSINTLRSKKTTQLRFSETDKVTRHTHRFWSKVLNEWEKQQGPNSEENEKKSVDYDLLDQLASSQKGRKNLKGATTSVSFVEWTLLWASRIKMESRGFIYRGLEHVQESLCFWFLQESFPSNANYRRSKLTCWNVSKILAVGRKAGHHTNTGRTRKTKCLVRQTKTNEIQIYWTDYWQLWSQDLFQLVGVQTAL